MHASELAATRRAQQLASFRAPILRTRDQRLDRRLVHTSLATLIAIGAWRNPAHGLLRSERGADLRIRTAEDAWGVVLADGRRWQIACAWRASKRERALERPRVWTWERREKVLLMVTLEYAFLRSLRASERAELGRWQLRARCHRTGKRSGEVAAPLYRLRAARAPVASLSLVAWYP